jgi:DTW domain-containing protein YfiP
MNPSKYKSVSMSIDNWRIATQLSNLIIPNVTISKSKVVQLALKRLADEYQIDLVEVTPELLKPTEDKHASNN